MSSISIDKLTASYKTNRSQIILGIDSLQIKSGSINGFFGPNHVGKSSLLKIISQINDEVLINGRLLFENKEYDRDKNNPLILYVPQDYNSSVFPWLTIQENLRIILKALLTDNSVIEDKINRFVIDFGYQSENDLFKDFGFIKYDKFQKIKELSGGQLQILTILRALVAEPNIITMDEPFSALDIYKGSSLRKKIFDYLRNKKITTIIVGHELEEIIELTDTLYFFGRNEKKYGSITGIENSNVKKANIEMTAIKLKTKYRLY